jgi:exonuclease III
MKLVTWNCNGAFRRKYHELAQLQADIYVVQECENPEERSGEYKEWANNYLWIGAGMTRGLGIFASRSIEIRRLDWLDNGLQLFLPVRVNNSFNLVGIWTKHANSPTFRYVGQLWKYLQLHKDKMASNRTVICGDLNSNKIWDVWDRWWNHSDVIAELNAINILSLYHASSHT